MQPFWRHLRRNSGLYSAIFLMAGAALNILEGLVLGRVRAFGIGRGHITPAEDPIQFYAVMAAAFVFFGLFSWMGVGIVRADREIKRKYPLPHRPTQMVKREVGDGSAKSRER